MRRNRRKELVRESIATADIEKIEEKISEIFESMNLGRVQSFILCKVKIISRSR